MSRNRNRKRKKRTTFLLLCLHMYVCVCNCDILVCCAWNAQVINIPWRTGGSWCLCTKQKIETKIPSTHTRAKCALRAVNCELETRNTCYDFIVDIRFCGWRLVNCLLPSIHSFIWWWRFSIKMMRWFYRRYAWRTIKIAKVKINVESDSITVNSFGLPFFSLDL